MLLSCFILKAQTSVYSLQEEGAGIEEGAYYKDTNNDFDKFVGTWKYQSGSIIFEITFQKRVILFDPNFNNYMDMLIGEYRYINENGVEEVNTLPNLQFNLGPYENNISGNLIYNTMVNGYRTIELYFKDPERTYLELSVILQYIPASGNEPEKIQLNWTGDISILSDENSPTEMRVPQQEYILEKQ